MAVLLKNNAVFLHVPKTVGTWVTQCIDSLDLLECHIASKHADVERINNFWRHYPYFYIRKSLSRSPRVQHEVNKAFKFCFVRHPWDWVQSYYRFAKQEGFPKWGGVGPNWRKFGNSNWHPCEPLYDLKHDTFNNFLHDLVTKRPGFVHELFSWYSGNEVDFIGKQETLENDLISVLRQAGIHVNEKKIRSQKKINVSGRDELNADPDLVREFHRVEYPTLVRYGYQTKVDLNQQQEL